MSLSRPRQKLDRNQKYPFFFNLAEFFVKKKPKDKILEQMEGNTS